MKKIKTKNLKVLPLDRWMSCDEDIEEEKEFLDLRPTTPVFKKPGWYVFGKACWFETPSGKAYHYDIKQFKFELSLHEVSKYNHRQISALKEFINQGLATRKQRELYYLICHYYQSKEVGRSAMKMRIRFDNMCKEEEEAMVSYAHYKDPTGIRFRQYKKDKLPVWAVDIKPCTKD